MDASRLNRSTTAWVAGELRLQDLDGDRDLELGIVPLEDPGEAPGPKRLLDPVLPQRLTEVAFGHSAARLYRVSEPVNCCASKDLAHTRRGMRGEYTPWLLKRHRRSRSTGRTRGHRIARGADRAPDGADQLPDGALPDPRQGPSRPPRPPQDGWQAPPPPDLPEANRRRAVPPDHHGTWPPPLTRIGERIRAGRRTRPARFSFPGSDSHAPGAHRVRSQRTQR